MNADWYSRVREGFFAVFDLDPSKQAAALEQMGRADPALRAEVERLLLADQSESGLLRTNACDRRRDRAAPTRVPFAFDKYRIVRLIAEGGMGAVYEAEQHAPRRTVALKVLRSGFVSARALHRFDYEAEVLALLHHPGIAQILEAGSVETQFGPQPFFAMEFVRGEPLLDHVRNSNLSLHDRVALMIRICEAVHHAHQRGVIHRDLKPSNILVVGQDSTKGCVHASVGQPKVLDFGVARCIDADTVNTTLQTATGQLIGTVAYMSPEQAAGKSDQLDVRTDVYALGVITFELLADRLPHPVEGTSVPDVLRAIQEAQPGRLGAVNRNLRGDLETIVAKTLRREKHLRYESVSAFAADLRRFLDRQPIAARPPSAIYQMRRFSERNPTLVASCCFAMVLLLAGAMGTTAGFIKASNREREAVLAREVSDLARAEALGIANFLINLLHSAHPADRGADVRVTDILAEASARLENHEPDVSPLTVAHLRHIVGLTYLGLGEAQLAELPLRLAVRLRQDRLGDYHVDTVRSTVALGAALTELGRFEEAESLLREATEIGRQHLGPANEVTLDGVISLASLLRLTGRHAAAIELLGCLSAEQPTLTTAWSARRSERVTQILHALWQVAASDRQLGRLEAAETLLTETISLCERLYAPEALTLLAKNELGLVYVDSGRYRLAEVLYRNNMESQAMIYGLAHRNTLTWKNNLALLLVRLGRYMEAEPLLTEVIAAHRSKVGEAHLDTLTAMNNLALMYDNHGQHDKADGLWTRVLHHIRELLGPEHKHTLTTQNNLGTSKLALGQFAAAEELLVESFESRRRILGEEHPDTGQSLTNLGKLYRQMGDLDRAEAFGRQAVATNRKCLGPDNISTLGSLYHLARTLLDQGRCVMALEVMTEVVRYSGDREHAIRGAFLGAYGRALFLNGQVEESEQILLEAIEVSTAIKGSAHPSTGEIVNWLAELHQLIEVSRTTTRAD